MITWTNYFVLRRGQQEAAIPVCQEPPSGKTETSFFFSSLVALHNVPKYSLYIPFSLQCPQTQAQQAAPSSKAQTVFKTLRTTFAEHLPTLNVHCTKKATKTTERHTILITFFCAVNVQYGLPIHPNLCIVRLLPVPVTVVPPEMHLYSRKGLQNIAAKNLFPQPALLPHLSSGVTGAYHTKKSCLQYVQSTPTPIPRYKNFPLCAFSCSNSLCPIGLTARGENTWRSFALLSCGRKRVGASYDTNSQCGRCSPSETTTELCRVAYLQGSLLLQLYSQL